MNFDSIVAGTAISAAIGSALVGLWGNLPFGLAPGMGLNSYFTSGWEEEGEEERIRANRGTLTCLPVCVDLSSSSLSTQLRCLPSSGSKLADRIDELLLSRSPLLTSLLDRCV